MGFRPYEGHDVTDSGIELPGAGGGFHKSLKVDNLEMDHRERRTFTVEVECTKVRYDLVHPDLVPDDMADDDDRDPLALRRVSVLKVIGVAVDDSEEGRARLDSQAAKVAAALAEEERAKKAARGELPFGAGDDAPSDLCAHDLPRDECEDCPPLPLEDPEPAGNG